MNQGDEIRFKVVRTIDGQIMMQTSEMSCVYDDETIQSMNKAGYKTYMNGKAYRPAKDKSKPANKKSSPKMSLTEKYLQQRGEKNE